MSGSVAPIRYRTGAWGTINVVLGAVFLPAFVVFAVLAWTSVAVPARLHGFAPFWSALAALCSALAAVVALAFISSGISTWRAVLLDLSADPPALSLPVFALRVGFRRVRVPVAEVAGVRMAFRHDGRNSRWQLVVDTRDGGAVLCDSVTSSASSRGDVTATRAGRLTHELAERLSAARRVPE